MLYAWLMLWMVVMFKKPSSRNQKGYIWRALKKLPPWRWIRDTGAWHDPLSRAYPRWLIVQFGLLLIVGLSLLYPLLIILEIDDWVNGDDENRKRRWDLVRNKIKWLMELPAPPQEVRVHG